MQPNKTKKTPKQHTANKTIQNNKKKKKKVTNNTQGSHSKTTTKKTQKKGQKDKDTKKTKTV